MAKYRQYGAYEESKATRLEEELEKDVNRIQHEIWDIDRRRKAYGKPDLDASRLFHLQEELLEKTFSRMAESSKARVANLNQNKTLFNGSERRKTINRITECQNAAEAVRTVRSNSLVEGDIDYTSLMRDSRPVFELEGFVGALKQNQAFKDDPDIQAAIRAAEQLTSAHSTVLNTKETSLVNQVKEAFAVIEAAPKDTTLTQVVHEYHEEVKKVINKNGVHALENSQSKYSDMAEGRKKHDGLHAEESLKRDIEFAFSQGNMDLATRLQSGTRLVSKQAILDQLHEMVTRVSDLLPEKERYGKEEYDFTPVHDKTKAALTTLTEVREKMQATMDQVGYTEAHQQLEAARTRYSQVMTLSRLYERLGPNVAGSVRKDIENDIDNYLSGLGLSGPELDVIKMEAQNVADAKRNAEMAEAASKADAARVREDRQIAQANLTGLSEADLDEIARDVTRYAKSQFTDEREREEYIRQEIARRAEHKAGLLFDEGRREIASQEAIIRANTEKQQEHQFTDDQLQFAADRLVADGMISSFDLRDLSQEEMGTVIDYAIKLKGLAGKSDQEIAEAMVTDPYVSNGRIVYREVNAGTIMAQKQVNDMHGLHGDTLEAVYGPSKEETRSSSK